MQIGAVLAQNELGDIVAIRDFAQGVQDLGYDFLVVADHVVGADKSAYPELERVYPLDNVLHEPLALFAYLAGVAPKLGLLTSVIILPQRQTALVAKQAAEIDILSGGKFRLGVGIGWNQVEYDALGMPFRNRGRRFEEQIEVMRRLWRERAVDFAGRYHTLKATGINPRPASGSIPVWIGAHSEVAAQRACRIADGYLPLRPFDGGWDATIDKVHGWLREAGRESASFGLEGQFDVASGSADDWRKTAEMWRRFGASHVSVRTHGSGGPDKHLARLSEVREALR